jgi:hypothetical protein
VARTLFLAFLAALLGVAIAAAPGRAQEHKKALEGVVASVEGNVVKLESGEAILTDEHTKVTRGGRPARVADLQRGDRVKYHLLESGKAMYLHAQPPKQP